MLQWDFSEIDVPVRLSSVDQEIWIRPGDIIIGDADGVACVPRSLVTFVLEMVPKLVSGTSSSRLLGSHIQPTKWCCAMSSKVFLSKKPSRGIEAKSECNISLVDVTRPIHDQILGCCVSQRVGRFKTVLRKYCATFKKCTSSSFTSAEARMDAPDLDSLRTKEYWENRYNIEPAEYEFDWFKSYNDLAPSLNEVLRYEDTILILGCGNSVYKLLPQ